MKRVLPRQSLHATMLAAALAVALGPWSLPAARAADPVTTLSDPVAKELNAWAAEGSAAGLKGVGYENRDEGHSMFDHANYPQLQLVVPSPEEAAKTPSKGPAMTVRPQPLFANSSMAAAAEQGGSLPRLTYYEDPKGLTFLSAQYLGNNLCFYPEHQDHDEGFNGRGGWGDLYPTNSACLLISQGSSFTDKPFLQAFIRAMAALQPDVQATLIKTRLLMPTLQSLFRQTYGPVKTEEDYFTGKAHPVVFDGARIDEERFIRRAHGLTVAAIPPVVLIQAIKETTARPGVDFFEAEPSTTELLADSPCVIARIFRSSAFRHEMTVTARKTGDLKGRLLDFKWVLLQGDPKRVSIKPSATGEEAKISVAWHPLIQPADNISSHRVDIGVFATNGVTWSAPAFITFYMLPNEARFYDAEGRVEEICYEAGNPDIGVPEASDLGWLSFGRRLTSERNTLAMKLVRQALPKTAVTALASIAEDLAGAQTQWRKLDEDKERKAEADKALADLKLALKKRIEKPTSSGKTLVQTVTAALSVIADDPALYPALQDQIQPLLRLSPKPDAARRLEEATERLVGWSVLRRVSPEQVALAVTPQKLTAGERYQLRLLNLAVLNEALLPGFLERKAGPAFVDPRLTTPKPWRDVYRYDKNHDSIGWTRYVTGKASEFDLDGKLLPNGRGGAALPVRYLKEGGQLIFAP